jgi:hypothetical protein
MADNADTGKAQTVYTQKGKVEARLWRGRTLKVEVTAKAKGRARARPAFAKATAGRA